jgi:hypothetical protein
MDRVHLNECEGLVRTWKVREAIRNCDNYPLPPRLRICGILHVRLQNANNSLRRDPSLNGNICSHNELAKAARRP